MDLMGIVQGVSAATTSAPVGQDNSLQVRFLEFDDLPAMLNSVANWFGLIAGIIAFFFLLVAGLTYITAGGNPEQAKKGQTGIINALIGLAIIAVSYALVKGVIKILNP